MSEDKKTPEDLAKEVKDSFAKAQDEAKAIAEKALHEAKKTGDLTAQTKEKADEALLKMNELNEKLSEMEQKLARRGTSSDGAYKSLGQSFVENDTVKSLLESSSKRGRAEIEVKQIITSLTTDAAGSAGDAIARHRIAGIQEMPERRMTVRDLITPGTTDSNAIEYVKETGFTNSAAPVAEGVAVAQSDIKLDLVTSPVKSVGHMMKASRQILDDAPQLASFIDGRLRYGLAYAEESQLLYGDGTGENLLGLVPQATAYNAPITLASPTSLDVLRLAQLQVVLAEYPATGYVMNPIDWAWIELLKDDQGRYIIGQPQGNAQATLWGLPVVLTQAMQVDKFLTGAYKLGAQIFDRMSTRVEIATENEDDFKKRLVSIMADERLSLATYRPQAFIYGDFGRVA